MPARPPQEAESGQGHTMKNHSPEVDRYIADAAEFARPILKRIRELFHKACPQIEETMKWGFPHFEHQGIVGSMAAFKKHAAFAFWKGELLRDSKKLLAAVGNTSMVRTDVNDVSQLPSEKVMLAYIREAVALNEQGVKVPKEKKPPKQPLQTPDFLIEALKKNKKASAAFEAFSPSHRREYIEWLNEAKQPETRAKRLATAMEWMAEGKPRNWKYMRK